MKKKSILTCWAWSFVTLGVLVLLALFIIVGIQISQNRNPMDACENFYVHACSKPFIAHTLNETNAESEYLNELIKLSLHKLQSSTSEFARMIDVCINTYDDNDNSAWSEPLQDLLERLGAFSAATKTMRLLGLVTRELLSNGLFNVLVVPNFFESKQNVILLSTVMEFVASPIPHPFVRIPKLRAAQLDEIKRLVYEIVKKLDLDRDVGKKDVADMVQFWFQVNRIKVEPIRNDLQLMDIQTLSEITHLDWLEFFQTSFGVDANVTSNNPVIVHEKEKILETARLMLDACGAPRSVSNYAIFSGIRPLLLHTDSQLRNLTMDLEKITTFRSTLSTWLLTREQMCFQCASEQLPYQASVELYEDVYTAKDTQALRLMFNTIQGAFYEEMSRNEWLSATSKKKMLNKLEKMGLDLYYPEMVKNSSLLKQVFPVLLIKDNHFQNVLTTTNLNKHLLFSKLYVPANDEQIWTASPLTISAWNVQYANKIQLPIGLLLYKKFSSRLSLVEQYSDIGFILAHEIAHGFDSTGIHFNENGLADNSLLDKPSKRVFHNKMNFLMRQYNSFCPQPDLCVNGAKTLDENIADVVGVKMSYLGFLKALQTQGQRNEQFPNFIPYASPEMQFFYSYAAKNCIYADLELVEWIIKYTQHSPNQQRVNGPLSNLEEFSQIFQCQWVDSMDPVTKFRLW